MEKNNRRNSTIDAVKLISAILVVFLHTVNTVVSYNDRVRDISRDIIYRIVWSVNPVEFFFIVSAYFFFKNSDFQIEKLKKYVFRLLVLYFTWSLLYIDNIIEPFRHASSNRDYVISIVKIIRRVFFLGVGGHMWYLLSLLYGTCLLWIMLKRKHVKLAWFLAIGCYLIALASDAYFHFFDSVPAVQSGCKLICAAFGSAYLFRGPVFILLGYYISQQHKVNKVKMLVLFIVMAFANNIEVFLIKENEVGLQCSTTICKPIVSYLFVSICVNSNMFGNRSLSILAKISTVMYFSHIFVRNLLLNFTDDMYCVWGLTIVICSFMAIILHTISRKYKQVNMIM